MPFPFLYTSRNFCQPGGRNKMFPIIFSTQIWLCNGWFSSDCHCVMRPQTKKPFGILSDVSGPYYHTVRALTKFQNWFKCSHARVSLPYHQHLPLIFLDFSSKLLSLTGLLLYSLKKYLSLLQERNNFHEGRDLVSSPLSSQSPG